MKREKAIEIPFGAKDSELIKWEYTIPEGMEAEIKDGKVIIKKAESEYERIRKKFVEYHSQQFEKNRDQEIGLSHKDTLAYLEKQKEPTTEELYAEAGTTEKEYIANTMKMVRAMREKQKEQKPAEWSEEDWKTLDEMREHLICVVGDKPDFTPNKIYDSFINLIDKLKSLRPSWKPSKEQMEALDKAIPVCMGVVGRDEIAPLGSLYEQLKKLI